MTRNDRYSYTDRQNVIGVCKVDFEVPLPWLISLDPDCEVQGTYNHTQLYLGYSLNKITKYAPMIMLAL